MKKSLLIFAGGMVAGPAVIAATAAYITPVRKALAKGVAKTVVHFYETDPAVREKVIAYARIVVNQNYGK